MLSERLRKIMLLICFLFPFISFAQDKQIDSLLSSLKIVKDDTSKVNLLNNLGRRYAQSSNFTEAKKYATDALTLAEKKKFQKGIKAAYICIANIYHQQGNIYQGQRNYSESIKSYLDALRIMEKLGEKRRMAYIYGNMGLVYWDWGIFSVGKNSTENYSLALKNEFICLKLFEEVGDKIGIAGTYNNIGLVYESQGNHTEALKRYFDAIKIYEELGEKEALIDRYFNIGFLYEDQGNYAEAIKNHLIAFKIAQEVDNKFAIAACHENMGEVYYHQGKAEHDSLLKIQSFIEALKEEMTALKMFKELGDDDPTILIDLGATSFELKNYSKAKEFLHDGLSLSGDNPKMIKPKRDSYQMLSALDSATGDWNSALNNHKLYILYRDSLINEESTLKTVKDQMQFSFDRKEDSLRYLNTLTNEQLKQQTLLAQQHQQSLLLKEKEVEILGNEKQLQKLQLEKDQADYAVQKAEGNKKQEQLVLLSKEKAIQDLQLKKQKQAKYYLIAGIALFVILSFFVYRNYRTRQKLKLQTLRNKIASDLHDDVGSTLSSISIFSQIAMEQSNEVRPMLQTIGDSSRKMLDAMADIVWTIHPENDEFEKIILRMRSFAYELLGAKRIEFRFVADNNVANMKLSMEARKNLYMIFKEATNNMVKYSEASNAMFTIKSEKDKLVMTIKDNGKGFDKNIETQGNGLKNMKKRAGEMGAVLMIDSMPGNGTTIKLELAV